MQVAGACSAEVLEWCRWQSPGNDQMQDTGFQQGNGAKYYGDVVSDARSVGKLSVRES